MNPIRGVLAEELENSERMLLSYKKALADSPRGSLVAKRIKGNIFYYLAYREGRKIKFDYLGKLSGEKVAEYQKAKALRAKHRKLASDLRKQVIFLKRALHERKRRSV